jgi:NADPH-dependent 2,4-dienoyl-CoA reductase/sulfur reductase-like enzyme/rhodanese-related sulfurtransferase
MRIVIIGGVAGGATAAARAARVNPRADIVILEKGSAVSFANCGLPYHVGGEIEQRDKLLVATPQMFRQRFGIQVRTKHEVISIDRISKTVQVQTHDGSPPYSLPYDRLILAPGAEPIILPWAAEPAANLTTLWTLADMDRILGRLDAKKVRRSAVVGAGYVGLEIVEQLARRGVEVTLIEKLPQVLALMDRELALPIEAELQRHGIRMLLGSEVQDTRRSGDEVQQLILTDGREIACDLVISAIGVRPRTQLAAAAGITLGSSGGIAVDGFFRTSDPDIFAVGDVAEYPHGVLRQPTRVPLAGPANRAGRIAGTVAAEGKTAPMADVLGSAIVRVFGKTAALTGLSSQSLTRFGISHRCAIIQAGHHANYFPGSESLTLKICYAPEDGKILGAQCVGGEGVDKRIDIVATVMSFGGTVQQLAGLDLCYAPPFGSAKDPVHMAAFTACNDLAGTPSLLPADAALTGLQVVDVRTPSEVTALPLAGACQIPVDELRHRIGELDPQRDTVVVCHTGKRAHIAACLLQGMGFRQVSNLTGGMSVRQMLVR